MVKFVGARFLIGFEDNRPVWASHLNVVCGKVSKVEYSEKHVDLEGGLVLPGFIDTHVHVYGVGIALKRLDLRGVKSIEELKEKLAKKVEEVRRGEWIIGRGWDQENFKEKRFPTRWDLDEVSPHNPVILYRICGHVAVVNSLALEKAGINENTRDPPGGVIVREHGIPNGVLLEDAINLVSKVIPSPSPKEYEEAVLNGLLSFAENGVTTVHAMSVCKEELQALLTLWKRNKLPIRVRIYVCPTVFNSLLNTGFIGGFGDDMLKIIGVKILLDGSFGGRTARLREPYSDDPSTRGELLYTEEQLANILEKAYRNGFQVAAHAIGDEALELLLTTIKKLRIPGHFVRIEHASLTPPDLLDLMVELGVKFSVQPHFVITDWWVIDRLGVKRGRWVYAFKTLIQKGLLVTGSSDAPVEPHNPWTGVYAAVTRGEFEDLPIYKVGSAEALDLATALKIYTVNGGKMTEEPLGCLKEGFYADFILLNVNPFSLETNKLKEVRVLKTFVSGKEVRRR